jgi:hypothetical protein
MCVFFWGCQWHVAKGTEPSNGQRTLSILIHRLLCCLFGQTYPALYKSKKSIKSELSIKT